MMLPHAGLQHTYGYLFSIIDTPYGRKRDRWVTTSLEESLGLPEDILSPVPSSGTLLSNATWLAGLIAFSGHRRQVWLRRCLRGRASQELAALQQLSLGGYRLVESVDLRKGDEKPFRVQLITDLIRFPYASRTSRIEPWLLVYSVLDERLPHPELVTLFAVSDAFADELVERASVKRRSDIRQRYNAYVSGLPDSEMSGSVSLMVREPLLMM
ncbi:MAG: hypothetical protein R3C49_04940 [Planctomycetaceae bacterium]